jgi:Type VI secretion system (T6SS), amidase immunity protein
MAAILSLVAQCGFFLFACLHVVLGLRASINGSTSDSQTEGLPRQHENDNDDQHGELKRAHDEKQEAERLLDEVKPKIAEADKKLKEAREEKEAADTVMAEYSAKLDEAEKHLRNAQTEKEQADKLLNDASSIVEDPDVKFPHSPIQYLKNFALSVCISDGYKSVEVVKDSLDAAGGYFELGSFPIEAYEEAEALGKGFLAKEYKGIHGEQLTLMKCIDLFHSKDLDDLAKKYGEK